MTWEQFKTRVEAQMAQGGYDQTSTPLLYIEWDARSFGGPEPAIYINRLTNDDGVVVGIGISED